MPRPDEELPLSPLKPVDEDVRREVADHLERRTRELTDQGWPPDAARREAERAFGDISGVSAACAEITRTARRRRGRTEWWGAIWQDVRYAFRILRRSPAFTATAIATLALGIGAITAVFSAIDRTFLRGLPFDHPERIVDVSELHRHGWAHIPWTNFLDIRAQNRSFEALAQYNNDRSTVVGGDVPMRVMAAAVSNGFFQVFHAQPMLGRGFLAEDHRLGAAPTAIVSYRFWRDHLGAARDLSTIRLRGAFAFQVIGVMPPTFSFPDNSDLWYPLELEPQPVSRTAHNGLTVGRLLPTVDLAGARSDLALVQAHIATVAGDDFDATGFRPVRLQDDETKTVRQPLTLLLGAAALLLLVACTNLASTLLARGAARGPELAVRTAIGAGRQRIARQLLTESVVLGLLGATAGLAMSLLLGRAFTVIAPASLAALDPGHVDARVLGFALAIGVATAILFGSIPAIRLSDLDGVTSTRDGARVVGTRTPVWTALVVTEVALAVVLLIGAGLLLRSFSQVMRVDLGFDPADVITAQVDLSTQAYPDVSQAVAYHDRALAAIRAIPGVVDAGATLNLPLEGGPDGGIDVDGRPRISTVYPITGHADYRIASTGYLRTMRMRLLHGRDFSEQDDAAAPPVALVNEAFARANWPDASPVGKRFRVSGMDAVGLTPWATVIGVVHDVPGQDITRPVDPAYFFSYRQMPFRARWLTLVVRSSRPAASVVPAIRPALLAIDRNVPPEFALMSDRVASAVADRRFLMLLLAAFAAVALLLAGLGIYGVVAYSVAQRTREIGIRIALGARPRTVQRAVQARAMRTVAIGVVVGVAAAWVSARLLSSLVYGVTTHDPVAFVVATAALLGAAWFASWLPARRGTRIDPVAAMRGE